MMSEQVGGWVSQDALKTLEQHILLVLGLKIENVVVQIMALKETTLAAQEFAKAAADKAAAVQEHVNESSNEWRSTLSDFTGKVMTRSEIEQRMNAVDARVTELAAQTTARSGTLEGISRMVPWIIAGFAMLIAAAVLLRPVSVEKANVPSVYAPEQPHVIGK